MEGQGVKGPHGRVSVTIIFPALSGSLNLLVALPALSHVALGQGIAAAVWPPGSPSPALFSDSSAHLSLDGQPSARLLPPAHSSSPSSLGLLSTLVP